MAAYYNENEPFAAAWLRNLISAGRIAPGDVDERSIVDVRPDELVGYAQCHFFAGIAGWSLALRLAGWPDDRPVWTGSCPCQPFSTAGKRKGTADERHLWPAWFRLIRECRPPVVLGEQVPSAIAHGWLDAVFDDLEAEGYACGAGIAPAASVGAPHRRDRLWFVAKSDCHGEHAGVVHAEVAGTSAPVADADEPGLAVSGNAGGIRSTNPEGVLAAIARGGWWASEPGMGRVANGVPGRVGRLRAYGNAIIPQVAAEFIGAFMDVRNAELSIDKSNKGATTCPSI